MGIGFGRGDNCVLDVEKGTTAEEISVQLKECGAVKIPFLFRVYAKLTGYENQFKYGVYNFNTESGYEAIAEMLIFAEPSFSHWIKSLPYLTYGSPTMPRASLA